MPNEPVQPYQAAAVTAKGGANKPKHDLKKRVLEEANKFLVITLYIWAILALVDLHRTIVLEQRHIDYQDQGFDIVNALILAKVVLTAEYLHLGTRFRAYRLIYSVLYKSVIFAAVLVCFHIIEGVAVAWLRARPLSESLADFGRGDLKGIASVAALVAVAFIPFFMFREAARVIGGDHLWQLFFDRGGKRFRLSVQE
jgi:hypothetical protein